MIELEAEARARAEELDQLDKSMDSSDADMTLEKTIVLSSGSSQDSPLKAVRRSFFLSKSPRKVWLNYFCDLCHHLD